MCPRSTLMELNDGCVFKVSGLLLWKTRKHFTDEKALSPLSLSPPSFTLSSSVPFLFPPSLFPLWEIMWLFDLRRDEWQWFSKSSPVSITLRVKYQQRVCVCVSVRECVCPVLPITPLGSVTLWQKALIFQFYHTPLSQLSPSCSLPYHPRSAFFPQSPRPVPDIHPAVYPFISSQTCLKGAVNGGGEKTKTDWMKC